MGEVVGLQSEQNSANRPSFVWAWARSGGPGRAAAVWQILCFLTWSRLRDELHAKRREAEALEAEVGTLHAGLATKERALAAAAAARDALSQRALQAEGACVERVLCGFCWGFQ